MKAIYIAVLALTCVKASADGLPTPTPTVDLETIRLNCAAAAVGVALSKKALQDLNRQGWDTAKLCDSAGRRGSTLVDLENAMTQSEAVCGSRLSLDDLSTEVAGVTKIEVKESLCVNTKQFGAAVISDPEQWSIREASDGFSIMTPKTSGQSMLVLFEPGKITGHAVMILATCKPALQAETFPRRFADAAMGIYKDQPCAP